MQYDDRIHLRTQNGQSQNVALFISQPRGSPFHAMLFMFMVTYFPFLSFQSELMSIGRARVFAWRDQLLCLAPNSFVIALLSQQSPSNQIPRSHIWLLPLFGSNSEISPAIFESESELLQICESVFQGCFFR
jgi:hypothetical protein